MLAARVFSIVQLPPPKLPTHVLYTPAVWAACFSCVRCRKKIVTSFLQHHFSFSNPNTGEEVNTVAYCPSQKISPTPLVLKPHLASADAYTLGNTDKKRA